jgi:hypothetical protein
MNEEQITSLQHDLQEIVSKPEEVEPSVLSLLQDVVKALDTLADPRKHKHVPNTIVSKTRRIYGNRERNEKVVSHNIELIGQNANETHRLFTEALPEIRDLLSCAYDAQELRDKAEEEAQDAKKQYDQEREAYDKLKGLYEETLKNSCPAPKEHDLLKHEQAENEKLARLLADTNAQKETFRQQLAEKGRQHQDCQKHINEALHLRDVAEQALQEEQGRDRFQVNGGPLKATAEHSTDEKYWDAVVDQKIETLKEILEEPTRIIEIWQKVGGLSLSDPEADAWARREGEELD